MFCKKCGSQVPDNVKFCTNCGSPVNSIDYDELNSGDTVLLNSSMATPPVNNQSVSQPVAPQQPPMPYPQPAAYPQQPAVPDKKGLSTGAILGIVFGSIALVAVIAVVCFVSLFSTAEKTYNRVSKNAKLKQCKSNIRIIEGNLAAYLITGNNGGPFTPGTTADEIVNSSDFRNMFRDGEIPVCESDGEHEYEIEIEWEDGQAVYSAHCTDPKCPNYGE